MVRPSSKLFTPTSNLLYFFSLFFTSTNDDIGGGQNIHIYFLLLHLTTLFCVNLFCIMLYTYCAQCVWGMRKIYLEWDTTEKKNFFYHERLAIFLSIATLYNVIFYVYHLWTKTRKCICLSINIEWICSLLRLKKCDRFDNPPKLIFLSSLLLHASSRLCPHKK